LSDWRGIARGLTEKPMDEAGVMVLESVLTLREPGVITPV